MRVCVCVSMCLRVFVWVSGFTLYALLMIWCRLQRSSSSSSSSSHAARVATLSCVWGMGVGARAKWEQRGGVSGAQAGVCLAEDNLLSHSSSLVNCIKLKCLPWSQDLMPKLLNFNIIQVDGSAASVARVSNVCACSATFGAEHEISYTCTQTYIHTYMWWKKLH